MSSQFQLSNFQLRKFPRDIIMEQGGKPSASRTVAMPPVEFFPFIVKETKDRIKIGDAISACIEDFAEIEASYGKMMSKISNASIGQARGEWLQHISGSWESVYRCEASSK